MPGFVRVVLVAGLAAAVGLMPGCRSREKRAARSSENDRVTFSPGSPVVPAPAPASSSLVPGESSVPLRKPGRGAGPSIPLAPPALEFGDETTYLPPPPDSAIAAPAEDYFPQRQPRTNSYDFFPSGSPEPADQQAEIHPGRMKRFWNSLTSPMRRSGDERK